jgi:carbamate kinase
MRIVAALGGNALLERGEPPESGIQEAHVIKAVQALAPLADGNDLVITHGNGPQVGMLALESAHDPSISRPYPFDVLGAQTQGSSLAVIMTAGLGRQLGPFRPEEQGLKSRVRRGWRS